MEEQGTECGERGGRGGDVIFPGMLPNILGMSPNIPGNIDKHSGECGQTLTVHYKQRCQMLGFQSQW